jgi:hypothetical protein
MAIFNYDDGAMELLVLGMRVYMDPDLISKATRIPHKRRAMLTSKKNPKLENVEMANKICGEKVFVPMNRLRMQDVPPRLYRTWIQIVLKTIMNHHK